MAKQGSINFGDSFWPTTNRPIDGKTIFENLEEAKADIIKTLRFTGLKFTVKDDTANDHPGPREYWFTQDYKPEELGDDWVTIISPEIIPEPQVYLPEAIEGKDWEPEISQALQDAKDYTNTEISKLTDNDTTYTGGDNISIVDNVISADNMRYDDSELRQAISGLIDSDTIYDDSELREAISGIIDNDTIYDDSELREAISGLVDNDTIPNDATLTISGLTLNDTFSANASVNKSILITPENIGASPAGHTHVTGPHTHTESDIEDLGNYALSNHTHDHFTNNDIHVTLQNKSDWDAKYDKPADGIPKGDLAESVQNSLSKADTALQSFTETDPTVPSWAKESLNGTKASQHTHDYQPIGNYIEEGDSRLSDDRNAKDVSPWAKAENKPTYNYGEIEDTPDPYELEDHDHAWDEITNKPAFLQIGTTGTTAAAGNHSHEYLTEEEDPTVPQWAKEPLGEENVVTQHTHIIPAGTKVALGEDPAPFNAGNIRVTPEAIGAEKAFSKNSAFNKEFGDIAGTVAEGNHEHDYLEDIDAIIVSGHVSGLSINDDEKLISLEKLTNLAISGHFKTLTMESIGDIFKLYGYNVQDPADVISNMTENDGVFTLKFSVTNKTIDTISGCQLYWVEEISAPRYKVYFDYGEGIENDLAQSVVENSTAAEIYPEDIEGHNFNGWYDNSGLTPPKFNFNTPIAGEITLYGEYVKLQYKINYWGWDNDTNKYIIIGDETVEYGDEPSPPSITDKEGWHKTDNWDYIESGNFDYSQLEPLPAENDIYAEYEINNYEVKFVGWDYTDDINTPPIDIQYIDHGNNAIPPSHPNREGYDPNGWDKSYNNIEENIIIKAQYAIKTFTVTFNSDGGNITPPSQTVNWNATATIPDPAPTKTGYHLQNSGWTLNESSFNFSTPITGDITLVADWEINEYNVNFWIEGVIVYTEPVEYLQTATAHNPNKTGYTLNGWYLDDETFTNQFTFTTTPITSNLDLYAEWVINKYTVTFYDDDKVTVIKAGQTVNHGSAAIPPEDPTKNGYHFDSWDKDYSNVTSNLDIYATYTVITLPTVEVTVTTDIEAAKVNGEHIAPFSVSIKADITKGSCALKEAKVYLDDLEMETINVSQFLNDDGLYIVATFNGLNQSKTYNVKVEVYDIDDDFGEDTDQFTLVFPQPAEKIWYGEFIPEGALYMPGNIDFANPDQVTGAIFDPLRDINRIAGLLEGSISPGFIPTAVGSPLNLLENGYIKQKVTIDPAVANNIENHLFTNIIGDLIFVCPQSMDIFQIKDIGGVPKNHEWDKFSTSIDNNGVDNYYIYKLKDRPIGTPLPNIAYTFEFTN